MEHYFDYGIACALDAPPASAPITLRGEIEYIAKTAKEIGYQGIELQICDPQKYDWNNLSAVAGQMDMKYCAIATGRELQVNGLNLISEDPGVRRAAIDKLKIHIDLGAALGCMVIVGSMRSHIPDFSQYQRYEGYLTAAKLELAGYAAEKKVRIVVENITKSISNYLNTMQQVAAYVQKLGCENIGIHLDTYSMLAEENDIARGVQVCGPKLEYVHFSDSGRYYPGGGNVDFKAFMKALLDAGYQGWVATECIPYPDAYQCAKRGLDYIHALETCIRIERSINI